MIKELNHVAVRTENIDDSIKFYRDILGGEVIRDATGAGGKGRFVYVQIAEGVIELIQGNSGADNLGLQHIAFLISDDTDLDTVSGKIKKIGYHFTVEPKLSSSGDGRLAFFLDKSGVVFELIERKENIRIPKLENPRIKAFDHIAVRISDNCREACKDFYTDFLGFEIKKTAVLSGVELTYYSMGPDTLKTVYETGHPEESTPLEYITLRVDDCNVMWNYLTVCGILCKEGSNDFFIYGPDGEKIKITSME